MKVDVLKGVKIIDYSAYAAVPTGMRIAGDWGADVIHVETLKGDQMRSYGTTLSCPIDEDDNVVWQVCDASKRSVSLNLRSKEGMDAMFKLIESAEVFVTNTRYEVLKNMGLDYESFHKRFPSKVWAHTSGYGIFGEERLRPGYDVISYWSRGGALVDLGPAEGNHPMTPPIAMGDITNGIVLLAGLLAALTKARATGEGSMVEASLMSTAVWAGALMITAAQEGVNEPYPKSVYEGPTPLTNVYKCKDGEWLTFCIVEYDKFFPIICDILQLGDEVKNDPRFNTVKAAKTGTNGREFAKIIEQACLKFDRDYLAEQLLAKDMAFERAQHFKDITKDKQAFENHMVTKFTAKSGREYVLPCTPVSFSINNEEVEQGPAPLLGEHTAEVLKEVGYTDEQIQAMVDNGNAFVHP